MRRREIDVPEGTHTAFEVLALLSRKWNPVVVATLHHHGSLGFNSLLEAIPDLSSKVLTETLEVLQDAGLIERTVISESPLRVEYELTNAGMALDPIFDELGMWGDRYLETATPTILLADGDRRITDLYGQWLTDRYSVLRAHTGRELKRHLQDAVDVVVYDESLPGVNASEVPAVAGEQCRTILLIGDRPGVELLEIDCDDVRRKPIVRETALNAIDAQLRHREASAADRERRSLIAKRSLLESVFSPDHLERHEEYCALQSRLEALTDAVEE